MKCFEQCHHQLFKTFQTVFIIECLFIKCMVISVCDYVSIRNRILLFSFLKFCNKASNVYMITLSVTAAINSRQRVHYALCWGTVVKFSSAFFRHNMALYRNNRWRFKGVSGYSDSRSLWPFTTAMVSFFFISKLHVLVTFCYCL